MTEKKQDTDNGQTTPETKEILSLVNKIFEGCTKRNSRDFKDGYFNIEICPRTDTIFKITLKTDPEQSLLIYIDCLKINLYEKTIVQKNIFFGYLDMKKINFILTNYLDFIR